MKTAAALLLLLYACTGPNPDLAAAGHATSRAGTPPAPAVSAPGLKADAAADEDGADQAGAAGGGDKQLGGEVVAVGGSELPSGGDQALPGDGGAPTDADGGPEAEEPAAPSAPACAGPRARFFPEAPPVGAPSGDCPMACHRLAGCSSYETGGPDLCPCLADGDVERMERACVEACRSEQGAALLDLIDDSPTCGDLVAAVAEAFDPYAAACGVPIAQ